MLSAVCVGETMAMLTPVQAVPLHLATELHCGIGGAESNVAMGLAAMGLDSHWVSRVGRDGFGTRILNELSDHGVGVSGVEVDPALPTGLYVKVPAQESDPDGGSSVLYYRQGLRPRPWDAARWPIPLVAGLLENAALIHLSGITAALSPECLDLMEAILAAPRNGTDHQLRRQLAGGTVGRPGPFRPAASWPTWPTSSLSARTKPNTPSAPPTKPNSAGSCRTQRPGHQERGDQRDCLDARSGTREEVPALSVAVVEPVGAGDSFAAGYLSGMLFGLGQKASLRRGHVAAACTLTVHGDRGPLPRSRGARGHPRFFR